MQIAEAFVAIRPDAKGFKADVERDVETPLRNVKSLVAGLAVGAAAISFAKGGLDELKEQQQVAAKLEATLKATGGAANVTKDQLDDMASSLQNLTGEDAEAIQGGQALLLQFTKVRNELGDGNDIFDRASKAAMDLSAATGTDLSSAYQTLGRALEDPVQGTRALRAANVILSDAQKEQIRSMVEQGDQLGAQRYILDLLEAKVGGVAEALGETMPEKLKRAKNALDDVKASVVSAAGPALEAAATLATKAADGFGSLPAPVQTAALAVTALSFAVGPLSTALEGVRTVASGLRAAFDAAAVGVFNLAGNFSQLLAGGAIAAGIVALAIGLDQVNQAIASSKYGKRDLDALGESVKALADSGQIVGYLKSNLDGLAQVMGDQVFYEDGGFLAFVDKFNGAFAGGDPAADAAKRVDDLSNALYALGKDRGAGTAISALDALKFQLVSTGKVTAEDFDKAMGGARTRLNELAEAQGKQGDASKGAANAADEERQAQDKLAAAYGRQQDALKRLSDAKRSEFEAITSLGSDVAGYEAAQGDVTAARQKLAGARTPQEQAAALGELEAAVRRQADARVKVAETQAKVNESELTAADRARLYRDELDKLSSGMPALRAQLDPTIVLLDNLAQDRTANIHVEVSGVAEALGQLAAARVAIDRAAGGHRSAIDIAAEVAREAGVVPRASGGEVKAGRPYWVGEHGAEPFVPTEDGVILPAGSSMGGASIYAPVTIYGHDYSLDEAGRQFSTRIGELVGGGQR